MILCLTALLAFLTDFCNNDKFTVDEVCESEDQELNEVEILEEPIDPQDYNKHRNILFIITFVSSLVLNITLLVS